MSIGYPRRQYLHRLTAYSKEIIAFPALNASVWMQIVCLSINKHISPFIQIHSNQTSRHDSWLIVPLLCCRVACVQLIIECEQRNTRFKHFRKTSPKCCESETRSGEDKKKKSRNKLFAEHELRGNAMCVVRGGLCGSQINWPGQTLNVPKWFYYGKLLTEIVTSTFNMSTSIKNRMNFQMLQACGEEHTHFIEKTSADKFGRQNRRRLGD